MNRITLTLDDTTAARLTQAATREGMSESQWITRLIERQVDEWPESVRKLAGAWSDLPLTEEMRHHPHHDTEREPL